MTGTAREPTPATPLARWVAGVLRWGTVAAVAVIAAGFVWATLAGLPASGTRPVVDEIGAWSGDAVTAVGLLGLTLLPIAVLAVAAAAFWRARERRMVAITLGVAALILASLAAAAIVGPTI
jgi:hypothetical protein